MSEFTAPERLVRKTTSIAQLFSDRVRDTPEREAYRYPVGDQWRSMTWRQAGNRVQAIAAGLASLGLGREDRVGIVCNTRLEWLLCDLGILCAGGATTTVYPSSTAEECTFILADSETKYVFVEDASQLDKLRAHKAKLGSVSKVIVLEGVVDLPPHSEGSAAHPGDPGKSLMTLGNPRRGTRDEAGVSDGAGDWVMSLADLEAKGANALGANPRLVDDLIAGIQPGHLATLIYTSGTTGQPKGVRLLHECWAYTADTVASIGLWNDSDVQYLWLPMAHSFGKILMAAHISSGSVTAIDGRIPKIVENLAVVRPTLMAAVPRIFEKVYNRILEKSRQGSAAKQKIFAWAVSVGRQGSKVRQQGKVPGGLLALKLKIADRLVFAKIRALFGGRVRWLISGSAPLSRDIAEFFHACGILILEGYGLTETSAAGFVNRPNKYAFGSVGLAAPGTECKLSPEDSEILIKSPAVMNGYHHLPDETAAALTADGWLRTGDIGELDAQGFLRITDRKKDLIKTSNGKYVAPQHIEGKLKSQCPYLSQVIVHGDKRNYVTALVALDEESIVKWATANGIANGYADIVRLPATKTFIASYIDELNKSLAKHETVKKFEILPVDLTVDAGELTPSLKVKRRVVEKKYAAMLDKMYEA